LPEEAEAVICFCDCLNYLTKPDEVSAAFRQTFKGLAPSGLFLFDVHAPRTLEQYAEDQPFIYNERDISYIWTCEYDEQDQIIENELTFFVRDDSASSGMDVVYRRFEEAHSQRAYDPDWIASELMKAGF